MGEKNKPKILVYYCDFSDQWRETLKTINHSKPHLIIEIDDNTNIGDCTYYSGQNEGTFTPNVTIEDIDLDNVDFELLVAEWQSVEWQNVKYNEQLVRDLASSIIEAEKIRK